MYVLCSRFAAPSSFNSMRPPVCTVGKSLNTPAAIRFSPCVYNKKPSAPRYSLRLRCPRYFVPFPSFLSSLCSQLLLFRTFIDSDVLNLFIIPERLDLWVPSLSSLWKFSPMSSSLAFKMRMTIVLMCPLFWDRSVLRGGNWSLNFLSYGRISVST